MGVGVAYHPNPLDAGPIDELVRHRCITYLMATPTFLHLYLAAATAADFGSLRLVMVGAEKLPSGWRPLSRSGSASGPSRATGPPSFAG